MIDDERAAALLTVAREAAGRAYVPYSGFPVGAAALTADGTVVTGCNVENASFPEGWCAETSAIAAMVLAGERVIAEVCIVADGPALLTPCGGCRQRIREFAASDTPIHIAGPEGVRRSFTLEELLPFSFGPSNLSAR